MTASAASRNSPNRVIPPARARSTSPLTASSLAATSADSVAPVIRISGAWNNTADPVSTTASADGSRGAQVAEVVPGSADADAGLEEGDMLVSVDGTPIADSSQLRSQITRRAPGTEVTLGLERDGDDQAVTVTLGVTG